MLLLLLRNTMWAAWWPYSTMLLALDKAAQQRERGLFALNAKIAEIIRVHAEASFALAMQLAEAKDAQQAMALQGEHMRKQMESFARQLEEMRDLAAQIIQEASPATRTDAGATRSTPAAQDNVRRGAGAAYAPSSSATPGQSGRNY